MGEIADSMTFWIAFGSTLFVFACWLAYLMYNAPAEEKPGQYGPVDDYWRDQ